MKKIISGILMSMVLLLSLCVPALATNSTPTPTTVSIPITIDKDTAAGKTVVKSNISPMAGYTYSDAYIVRSGNTVGCNVYLAWSGSIPTNEWYFNSMTLQSTSILFPTTYKTFGSRYLPCTGATSGSVFVGYAEIPTDVTKVNVSITNLQEYNMTTASWLSAAWATTAVTLN